MTASPIGAGRSTLAELFRAARSTEITVDEQIVHSVLAFPVQGPTRLCIRRESARPDRPQALRLAAAVNLRVGAHAGPDVVLRSTTAPVEVEVTVDADDATVVYLWNLWTVDGVDHAWLADAGMLVETDLVAAPPTMRVRCRDGAGDATFGDLVVTITAVPLDAPSSVEPATAAMATAGTSWLTSGA